MPNKAWNLHFQDPKMPRPKRPVIVVELDSVRRASISQEYIKEGRAVFELCTSAQVAMLVSASPAGFAGVVWGPSCSQDPYYDVVEREVEEIARVSREATDPIEFSYVSP